MENTQLSLYGKTSPERSAAAKEKTSGSSWKNLLTEEERELIEHTVMAEAGGEDVEGMMLERRIFF